MSALLEAEITEDDGTSRKLTDEEAVAFIKLLSSAGNETTAKLIGWIGSTLADFPGERARLVKEKDLIRNGIEEILRYEPPALCPARVARREVVLHGEVVPVGGVVIFIQAATGRRPPPIPRTRPPRRGAEDRTSSLLRLRPARLLSAHHWPGSKGASPPKRRWLDSPSGTSTGKDATSSTPGVRCGATRSSRSASDDPALCRYRSTSRRRGNDHRQKPDGPLRQLDQCGDHLGDDPILTGHELIPEFSDPA